MSEHTPTPWFKAPDKATVQRENGWGILICVPQQGYKDGAGDAEENARRVTAAINATASFSTEALEAGVVEEMVEELRACQRLLAILIDPRGKGDGLDSMTAWANSVERETRVRALLSKLGRSA